MTEYFLSDEIKSLLDTYATAIEERQFDEARRLAEKIRYLWLCEHSGDMVARELESLLEPLKQLEDFLQIPETLGSDCVATPSFTGRKLRKKKKRVVARSDRVAAPSFTGRGIQTLAAGAGTLAATQIPAVGTAVTAVTSGAAASAIASAATAAAAVVAAPFVLPAAVGAAIWGIKKLFSEDNAGYAASVPEKASNQLDVNIFPVWFGTNRELNDPTEFNRGFSSQRSNQIRYGRVDVLIPEAHRRGETGSPWWKRWSNLKFLDDSLRVQRTLSLDEVAFRAELSAALEDGRKAGESHALVFLHGYNVSFKGAATRAAQLGCDLNVAGPTVFFSWPSLGKYRGYPADAARIEASEDEIARFLADFVNICTPAKVHLIAHSMGNRGLLRALQRLAANAENRTGVHFGQIFLAAPDVDRDVFLNLSSLYPKFAERTTLYASKGDKAVGLSRWLHGSPRAGFMPPVTVCSYLDTVEVQDYDLNMLGHDYVSTSESVMSDLFSLIRNGAAPDQRQGLKKISDTEPPYWKLF